jgi:hypothetical protein
LCGGLSPAKLARPPLRRRRRRRGGGVSGADYLSASSRNMLRKGLRLLFTQSIWTAPPT